METKKRMSTQKRILLHLSVGLAAGVVIGDLIALITGSLGGEGISLVSAAAKKAYGLVGAVLLQNILSGLLGAASVGGMLFYAEEKWGLAGATVLHFCVIYAVYALCAWLMGWLPPRPAAYLISFAAMAAVFAVIWLVMYLRWKKTVREWNEDLKKYKEIE